MDAKQYISAIMAQYPDEDPNDVVTMIDILAEARAGSRNLTATKADFDFAGKIICVILDPIKFKIVEFPQQMKSLRRAYRGIGISSDLQETFRESLKIDLVSAEKVPDAIEAGVDTLFRVPVTFDDD